MMMLMMMRSPNLLLISCLYLSSIPGSLSLSAVTLGSIKIFNTHEWLEAIPIVYFYCQGENRTVLPDVKAKHYMYTFKGEESWQPLTAFADKKCKRCGLYERDKIKSDDVFDEWELCPDDFVDSKYVHFKEKEFEATLLCSECTASFGSDARVDSLNVHLVIAISVLVSSVVAIGTVGAYKYWQKRKREQDQARFLKLFEDGDDTDEELDLGI